MKHFFIFILFFSSLKVFSQTDDQHQDKWKIGWIYSIDHFYSNSVSFGDQTGYYLTQHSIKFTTGAIAQLTIKPKLEIGAGIEYSNKRCNEIYYFPMDPTIDYIIFDSELELRYIEIPVTARYNFLNKNTHLHIETGLINGFLIKNKNTVYDRKLPINNFLLSGELGAGVNFNMDSGINFSITTVYRHSLTEFADGASSKLRSLGLMLGITYRIKKKS
jgi:hypothetical protein